MQSSMLSFNYWHVNSSVNIQSLSPSHVWGMYECMGNVMYVSGARWLHLARSGSQSQHAIWFILPARGAGHIIKGAITHNCTCIHLGRMVQVNNDLLQGLNFESYHLCTISRSQLESSLICNSDPECWVWAVLQTNSGDNLRQILRTIL